MTSTTMSCLPASLSPASQQRAQQLVALLAGGSLLAGSSLQGREMLEAVARLESGPSLNQSLANLHTTTGLSWSLCLHHSVCLIKTTSHSSSFNSLTWLQGALHNTFYCLAKSHSTVKMTSSYHNIRIRKISPKNEHLISQHFKLCCTIVWLP